MAEPNEPPRGWALITGASSGLGAEFARQLAGRGYDVILVARRKGRLTVLADEIGQAHGVQARAIPVDLADPGARAALHARLARDQMAVEVLVNNAGLGHHGAFAEQDGAHDGAMIELNVAALVHLTRLFLPDMLARDRGRILQVASGTAYQPTPLYAVYGATKAFVLMFAEALDFELRNCGVTASVLLPGFTDTEFFEVSGQTHNWLGRASMMDAARVARVGLRALFAGRRSAVPGLGNKFAALSTRLGSRRLTARVAHRLMKG